MYYSNTELGNAKLIDTVDFSSYKSMIHCFKSQNDDSYIVLWETEYEYYPLIYAYYVIDGKIVNIGELLISLPCQSCESFEYPIKRRRALWGGIEQARHGNLGAAQHINKVIARAAHKGHQWRTITVHQQAYGHGSTMNAKIGRSRASGHDNPALLLVCLSQAFGARCATGARAASSKQNK